jgi:hypothetical protein
MVPPARSARPRNGAAAGRNAAPQEAFVRRRRGTARRAIPGTPPGASPDHARIVAARRAILGAHPRPGLRQVKDGTAEAT